MVKRAASHKGKTANKANLGGGEAHPWWEILKVSATASLDEVAIAFRELAMQFHPDLWANATEDQRKLADSRMKMINAAFEKAEYDINARQKFTAKVEQEAAIRAMQKTVAKAQQKATVRTKRKSAAKAKQEPIDTASQVMSNIFFNPTARKKLRKTKIIYAVVVSVLAVLIFALIHFQNEPEAIAKVYTRGSAYLSEGQYDKAIADYTEALRLDPKYAEAYNNRGLAYKKKDYVDKAIADYTEALRLDPKYAEAYNNRGLAYRIKGKDDKAIADYTEALRLNPEYAEAYSNRGFAYAAKHDVDKVIANFTEAIRLNPKYPPAYYGRGAAYNSEKAKKDFAKAKELWE